MELRDNERLQEVPRYFDSLGSTIQDQWRDADYDEELFSDIAYAALRQRPPSDHLSHGEVIQWLATTESVPFQVRWDDSFGQPPLTLFWNGRFQIDILFWITGTTGIHQHGFSGAFAVLGGSSVQCHYDFRTKRKVNSHFAVGSTVLRNIELLEVGAVQPIARGAQLIHSLFHLDTPSVTVVVRTCSDPEAGPEYAYYVPSVAIDPSHRDMLQNRHLQILEMLRRIGSDELESVAVEILSRCDLQTTFLILLKLADPSWGAYARLLEQAREKHGAVIADLIPAIEEESRRQRVFALRRSVTDPELRFFLALILNLPDRPSIEQLIESRFTNASSRVEDWSVQLATAGALGIQLDRNLERLLRACLRGQSNEEIVAQLATEYSPEEVQPQVDNVREACQRLRCHPVLRPLFQAAADQA